MGSPRAGQPAAAEDLVDVAKLVTAYYAVHPDPGDAVQRVSFGTSGHRGSAPMCTPSALIGSRSTTCPSAET